ncbi:MAG: phage Gp37/Gp68 family protein [Leptospiraceae bacterium]|nr:phage Gp37/Gp68 family protein [Leptospiraceae bacterium]
MSKSKIEWTEDTWNPTTGCNKVSPGCKNCYAETMAFRLRAMGVKGYEDGFDLTLHENRITQPLRKRKPTTYFVNSMSDLFHKNVPFEFLDKVFETIENSEKHRFQILTKRPERMAKYFSIRTIPDNVWLGVSVEDKKHGLPRIDILRELGASIKFLSCEPLLEDLEKINLSGIDWVIVGGESGHRARPMQKEWVENIKMQCERQDVPFFFKQWGQWGSDGIRRNKKENGRKLNGKIFNGVPIGK